MEAHKPVEIRQLASLQGHGKEDCCQSSPGNANDSRVNLRLRSVGSFFNNTKGLQVSGFGALFSLVRHEQPAAVTQLKRQAILLSLARLGGDRFLANNLGGLNLTRSPRIFAAAGI